MKEEEEDINIEYESKAIEFLDQARPDDIYQDMIFFLMKAQVYASLETAKAIDQNSAALQDIYDKLHDIEYSLLDESEKDRRRD